MFQQGDFRDSIDFITLKFKNPDIEARFSEARKAHMKFCSPGKLMIIILSIATSSCLIAPTLICQDKGDISSRNSYIIVIALTNASWIIEFFIHLFPCLHFLAGFFYIAILSLAVTIGTCATYDYFAVAPGAISHFLLMLFVGMFYSKNWILAILAEAIGYILIFIISVINYIDKMIPVALIGMDISMLVGLFAVSFIYYYFEKLQRMSIFQQWQTEQVSILLKN